MILLWASMISLVPINFHLIQVEPHYLLWCIGRLAGNPACDANNVGRPTQLCDQPSGSKLPWSSPFVSNCPSVTCSDSLVLNPLKTGNCNCTLPLEMQLEARRPTFSVITDSLIESLRLKLVAQLNLQNSQVWISTAAFSADGRAEINVDFFSADGVSDLDRASTSNITHSLTSNSLVLDEIKPYLARVIVSGETFCESFFSDSLLVQ